MNPTQGPIDLEELADAFIKTGCYAATADEELLGESSFLLLSVYHEEITSQNPEQQIEELQPLTNINTVRVGSQMLQCDVVFDPDPPALLNTTALYADDEQPGSDLLTKDSHIDCGEVPTTTDTFVEKVQTTVNS